MVQEWPGTLLDRCVWEGLPAVEFGEAGAEGGTDALDRVGADGQAQGRLLHGRDRHDRVRHGLGVAERLGRQGGDVREELPHGRAVDVAGGDDVEAGGELGGERARFDDGDLGPRRREFVGEGLAEQLHGALGRRVQARGGPGELTEQ
ncbi:hypothetical protein ACGF3G_50945 [Streptomyces sp. NPDC048179]|uniref:hypothetical protein n=1 Tax=Streptomyces sp. NPDC048179 TaxID=3365506 RepID=UPI00371B7F58